MLQQTQVATVIPYFDRWMEAFPDIPALAEASLDDVLSHWSGLGYYARARNLHKTAVLCMEKLAGQLPPGAKDLAALPGIGQSTANAIVSQSTDQPSAVLDGNVRRVLARHAAVDGWTGKASVQQQLWQEAEIRLPKSRGADYTQAVMDLGATLCTRSNPRCGGCPVKMDCQALATGRVKDLPARKPATRVSDRTLHMLILRDHGNRVLLEKRAPAGIWGGLWCLPEGESIEAVSADLGVSCLTVTSLPPVEHRLSHVRMNILPALVTATDAGQVKCSPQRGWFDRAQQKNLGLPKPVSDLLMRLNNGEIT
jgi:A/G-specific adenine glycosylase